MRTSPILRAILGGQFLMEESATQAYLPLVAALLDGSFKAEDWRELQSENAGSANFHAIQGSATSLFFEGYSSLDEMPVGSVNIMSVEGVMMEEDTCFSAGTRTMGQRIEEADDHANIVAHVAYVNTPGGSVAGLERFANIVANTKKPFVVLAVQMCSAGVWGFCGADHIVANGRTSIGGSIGTKFDTKDYSEFFKKMGVVHRSITATKSTNKNAAFEAAAAGDPEPLRAQLLDPMNEVFLSTVEEHRGDKLPTGEKERAEVLSGMCYLGETLVAKGIADSMGTMQDAIQIALDLAAAQAIAAPTPPTAISQKLSFSTSNPNSMSLFGAKSKFPKLEALSGKTTITAEEATAANEELRAAGITTAALITEGNYNALVEKGNKAEAAEKQVTQLTSAKAKLEGELADSQKEVERLGALAGDNPTTAAKKDGDNTEASAKAPSYFDPNAEHNQEAAALLG
ncbi:S49 family peptidase [Hymenobacter sp. BT491]|uniref:S49 family peptidase n=1 Tax=Hymenobacter sp. BT491 TaxID=2766779 RepID=UPI001653D102|nr:S49 family peptidase [Hymenobacter sp. BT491]MBC6988558.1 S49 family peptidase [Hymenobacter sp. BT491]